MNTQPQLVRAPVSAPRHVQFRPDHRHELNGDALTILGYNPPESEIYLDNESSQCFVADVLNEIGIYPFSEASIAAFMREREEAANEIIDLEIQEVQAHLQSHPERCLRSSGSASRPPVYFRYKWRMVPLSEYQKTIPLSILRNAIAVKKRLPAAELEVHAIGLCPLVSFKLFGRRYFFDQWDEIGFSAERNA